MNSTIENRPQIGVTVATLAPGSMKLLLIGGKVPSAAGLILPWRFPWARLESIHGHPLEVMTKAFEQDPVDIVIIDTSTPNHEGVRALAHIRQRGFETPAILVGNRLGHESLHSYFPLGVREYLPQPISNSRLLASVAACQTTAFSSLRLTLQLDGKLTVSDDEMGLLVLCRTGKILCPAEERALVQGLAEFSDSPHAVRATAFPERLEYFVYFCAPTPRLPPSLTQLGRQLLESGLPNLALVARPCRQQDLVEASRWLREEVLQGLFFRKWQRRPVGGTHVTARAAPRFRAAFEQGFLRALKRRDTPGIDTVFRDARSHYLSPGTNAEAARDALAGFFVFVLYHIRSALPGVYRDIQRNAPVARLYRALSFDDVQSIMDDLAQRLAAAWKEAPAQSNVHVDRAVNAIHRDLAQSLSVQQLADQLQISPAYLSRLFKEKTGTTPSLYIQRLRVQLAQKRLKETRDSVATIAKDLGFSDVKYFRAVFKKHTTVSPGQYRRY